MTNYTENITNVMNTSIINKTINNQTNPFEGVIIIEEIQERQVIEDFLNEDNRHFPFTNGFSFIFVWDGNFDLSILMPDIQYMNIDDGIYTSLNYSRCQASYFPDEAQEVMNQAGYGSYY